MAIVGATGGIVAAKVMPRVGQVITTKVSGVKEALMESKVTRLGEPALATPEGVTIKMPTGKTPLEQINDSFKSQTTNSVSSNTPNAQIPNNPQPITQKTLEHIFHGEINKKGSAVGFHNDAGEMQAVNQTQIVKITKQPDARGIYEAEVKVQGVVKKAKSTFFPDAMNKNDVVKAINEAYVTKQQVPGTDLFIGESKSGMKVGMYVNKNDGTISTAFPIYGK